MSYIHRRIFYARVSKAEPLVNHFKELDQIIQGHGFTIPTRILTDYMSGRSDTVVVEWEVDDLAEMESSMKKLMENSEARDAFARWESALPDLITHSEGENWAVR